jgi:hypothetical protein
MNPRFTFNYLMKVGIACLLTLNLIVSVAQPAVVGSAQTNILPSEKLYQQALAWEYNRNDLIHAAIYMYAYVQRNPPEYAQNYLGRKDIVDQKLATYLPAVNHSVELLNEIRSDPNECKNSAGDQAEVCTIYAEGTPMPPPDAVLVCTKPYYQGICRILFVRNYSSYTNMGVPNDDISSVLVGSRVKLTLYLHSLSHPESITFLADDVDLSNNPISGTQYYWDNNVSSAKVEYK